MARFARQNDQMRPKHLLPDMITFSMFTSDEIRQLSVVQVVTSITLDNLGYPIKGGLYDKTMGPMSERSDPCGTCCMGFAQCSGHFGHIELPLPLVNPLFHNVISTILKISCLNCFKLQIPYDIKCSLILQVRLLNVGLFTEANEIERKMKELFAKYDNSSETPEDVESERGKYEKLIEKYSEEKQQFLQTKNTEVLIGDALNTVIKEVKVKKTCRFCKKSLHKITAVKNKVAITSMAVEKDTVQRISKNISPEESRNFIRNIWEMEREFLVQLLPVLSSVKCDHPTDVFYFDVIAVTPPIMRPVNIVRDMMNESPQTTMYRKIVDNTILCRMILSVIKNNSETSKLNADAKVMYNTAMGATPIEKLNYIWETLQQDVDGLLNRNDKTAQGLKQILEKKQGIIRQNMMGKRVNFAARSVITPDPNLNIDEIGIPEDFAKRLMYPVPVTPWNVQELRKMILNGPKVHPGAVMIQYEDGSITRINPDAKTQQESILKRLLTPSEKNTGFRGVKIVFRHLQNGDVLLLNRQPTLHKPSIMAHTARILKGEKTLRLHYANCKAYNADFDGDEMNAHFPQNELGRSEGYILANVCNQYLVPKDGTPLSGLIQDHIISAAKLSIRGRFFDKYDYQQLVFQGLSHKTSKIILLPPAIVKPVQLWSGKQVLSTIIINIIPQGKEPINLVAGSNIPLRSWCVKKPRRWKAGGTPFRYENEMSEAEVIIRGGELLSGILDKKHFGSTPYGLIHCIYELYGGMCATKMLSSFAKLFTTFLQREGFTLGVHDILILGEADERRTQIIRELRGVGRSAITAALDLPEDAPEEEIVSEIEESTAKNPKFRQIVDREYKKALDGYTNDINRVCLPAGLLSKFPHNNLQFMVESGGKGSRVNTMQISCLLGQIELEGKRPPVMISGKSLPSFPDFEFAPRSGGFIDGRFMTGIQPQEFFFHCMAGREGLIDTAVKTSRSGYLQRCLIKHLEGLTVGYDLTVRDSDRSVIQFRYGEDGMDISKVQFLKQQQMQFLSENYKALVDKKIIKSLKDRPDHKEMEEHSKKLKEWRMSYSSNPRPKRFTAFHAFCDQVVEKIESKVKHPNKISKSNGRPRIVKYLVDLWNNVDDGIKEAIKSKCEPCPEPVNSKFQPDCYFGSLNDHLISLVEKNKREKKSEQRSFENMLKLKAISSLCAPGEPVGLLAAQSIGEPSTQMTLNTFHFAGRGEMNVTLGIPRLREILMQASKNIKTPSMEIPFLDIPDVEAEAEKLKKILTRVVVLDVLEKIEVTSHLEVSPVRQRTYILRFSFLPHSSYKSKYKVKPKTILKHISKRFFGELFNTLRKYVKVTANLVNIEKEKPARAKGKNDEDEDQEPELDTTKDQKVEREEDSSDEEPEDMEDAKLSSKYDQAHEDQEPEEEEKEASDEEEEEGAEDKKDSKEDEQQEDGDKAKEIEDTQTSVINSYHFVRNYTYDSKNYLWCELTFALPLSFKRVDMTAILKETAAKSVLWQTPQIKRAITYMKDDRLTLRTEGINITEMFKYDKILDLNRLYSNDVHRIAETYGIEAATKVIVKEVQEVFGVYGIKVDPRHLSLIADYMTFSGTFLPMSRRGMNSSVSALQQMSFEASLTFLKTAIARGKTDHLENPSSSLMVGKPINAGTGCFTLLHNIAVK